MKPDLTAVDHIAWIHLTTEARKHLTNTDLDRLMEGAGLFTKQQRIDESIRTAFGNPAWWPAWRDWRNEWKRTLGRMYQNHGTNGRRRSTTLPYPPEEPSGVWEEAQRLLTAGTYLESVSAALIRLLFAQGRAARKVLDEAV